MTTIHPDWKEITERNSQAQKIPVVQEELSAPKPVAISRKPAAIVGILLVLLGGSLLFLDYEDLLGQLLEPESIIINIKDGALDKPSVTARRGQQIIWVNLGPGEQSLISATLCNKDNACFSTPTFLQGENALFTITEDVTAGTYEYSSQTTPSLQGTIIIEHPTSTTDKEKVSLLQQIFQTDSAPTTKEQSRITGTTAASQPVQSVVPLVQNPLAVSPVSTNEAKFSLPSQDSAVSQTSVLEQKLPTNPYVAGSTRVHPYDEVGDRLTDKPPAPTTNGAEVLHGAAKKSVISPQKQQKSAVHKKPFRQPDSGPTLWLGSALGALGLYLIMTMLGGNIRIVVSQR